uniref:Auxin-responsive protein n=3 Tax=Setaria TaxID=4554 RepID=K3ZUG7_SETIT
MGDGCGRCPARVPGPYLPCLLRSTPHHAPTTTKAVSSVPEYTRSRQSLQSRPALPSTARPPTDERNSKKAGSCRRVGKPRSTPPHLPRPFLVRSNLTNRNCSPTPAITHTPPWPGWPAGSHAQSGRNPPVSPSFHANFLLNPHRLPPLSLSSRYLFIPFSLSLSLPLPRNTSRHLLFFTPMEIDADNLSATELRLGLPGTSSGDDRPKKASPSVGAKRALDDTRSEDSGTSPAATGDDHDAAAPAKAQVVGWPPVRAYRKNTFQAAAVKKAEQQQQGGGLYVKVSMDGAPYLRKVDLRMYKGYRELREALDALFTKSFAAAEGGGDHQHALAYEDKDGDLMLVGDVPWDMFISSCKKLRIMKGSEAR